jgi:hypothetical protein
MVAAQQNPEENEDEPISLSMAEQQYAVTNDHRDNQDGEKEIGNDSIREIKESQFSRAKKPTPMLAKSKLMV